MEPGLIFSPTQELVNGEWIRLTGEITGEIVEANGCLRLNASQDDASYLIIWPPGYTFDASDALIQIRDETGRIVATTGEIVQMGGGGGTSLEGHAGVSEQLLQDIPSHCPGPYWISAGIISDPMNESE